MTEPYRVICADPPWKFGDKLPGKGRGAEKNYQTMHWSDIAHMELPQTNRDGCWLFLWRVAAMPVEAYSVVSQWGFTPKSEIVWEKLTKHGKPWFGMGRYVRASHETCIIAVRGKVKPAVRNIRSRFAAPVGRHSEKPEEFYRIVETLTGGGPFLEMFARKQRPGWTCLGNELGVTL